MSLADQLRDWVPIRMIWEGSEPALDWCYFGSIRFTDSFFEQTIGRVLRDPFPSLFRHHTRMDVAGELCGADPGILPSGFILHMSRCGSTLITQVLASLSSHIVISEAPILDDVLRAHYAHPEVSRDTYATWLRWIASALGRRRFPEEARFFVKLDCWHTCELPLLRQAFPGVPWIFVYRDPVEVMVSQLKEPARFTVPGYLDPRTIGLDPERLHGIPRHEYCARVLAAILEKAAQHAAEANDVLVEYRELPDAIWTKIGRMFSVNFTQEELATMRSAAKLDAKSPYFEFEPDSQRKQREASAPVREACRQWLDEPYARLESLRAAPRRAQDA